MHTIRRDLMLFLLPAARQLTHARWCGRSPGQRQLAVVGHLDALQLDRRPATPPYSVDGPARFWGRPLAIPPLPTSTRPLDPDEVATHGDVIVSEGPGDEVLRRESAVARK